MSRIRTLGFGVIAICLLLMHATSIDRHQRRRDGFRLEIVEGRSPNANPKDPARAAEESLTEARPCGGGQPAALDSNAGEGLLRRLRRCGLPSETTPAATL